MHKVIGGVKPKMPKQKASLQDFFAKFDRLPAQESLQKKLKEILDPVAAFYGFDGIYTSLMEDPRAITPLIKAGLCDERAPVFCKTRAGTEFALRLSGALSILRSYITSKMNDLPHPLKLSFNGDAFFLDSLRGKDIRVRPEWGLVMIGEEGPIAEAEVLQVIWRALAEAGFKNDEMEIRVNAIGCMECRPSFRSQFGSYSRGRSGRLCKNCKRYLKRTPTRLLLCDEEKCKIVGNHAPQVLDFLCDACKKHLRGFLEFLDEIRVPYFLDSRMFREGSWFSTLIFELATSTSSDETGGRGRAMVLAEGGRLSRAGELIAGRRLDAAGVTMFLDTAGVVYARGSDSLSVAEKPRVFLTQLGELAKRKSLGLLEVLRKNGIGVKETLGRDSVKSQLKVAELSGAEIALILGQKEALDNTIIVREVQSGIQETVSQEKLIEFLRKKLKRS